MLQNHLVCQNLLQPGGKNWYVLSDTVPHSVHLIRKKCRPHVTCFAIGDVRDLWRVCDISGCTYELCT